MQRASKHDRKMPQLRADSNRAFYDRLPRMAASIGDKTLNMKGENLSMKQRLLCEPARSLEWLPVRDGRLLAEQLRQRAVSDE
jgi:hypothetical protein